MTDAVETEAGVVFVESAPSEPEADFDQDAPLNERTPATNVTPFEEEKEDPTHKQYPVEPNCNIVEQIDRLTNDPRVKLDTSAPNAHYLSALDLRVRLISMLQADMLDMLTKISRIQRPPAVLSAKDIYARRDDLLRRIGDSIISSNDVPADRQEAVRLRLLEQELEETGRMCVPPDSQ